MDDRGYEARLLSAKQCLDKWPSLRSEYCKEGLFFPQEVSVEPEEMIHQVLKFMQSSLDTFTYKPSTVIVGCSPSGSQVIVSTSDGQLFTAEKVVVCNGGEFKLLFPDLFRKSGIVVSKLQMLRTVPMPEVNLEGNILTGLTIRRYESFAECPSYPLLKTPEHLRELTSYGIHILFKKARDHSIIIGDSHKYACVDRADDLGFAVHQPINDLMLTEAARIANFNVRNIATSWAGFYPQHPEKDVVEYDLEDCIHIRTAIGGKGMTSGAGYAEASIRKIFHLS
jgi:FAD dependent oxidoreductase TIGR03364